MSLEEKCSDIEKQYSDALSKFSRFHSGYDRDHKSISNAIKSVLIFQRKLELLVADVRNLSDEISKKYIRRCINDLDLITSYIRGYDKFPGALKSLDSANFDVAYFNILSIRNLFYRIHEDVRTIYSLKIYPIEEKMALKSKLSDNGLIEVVMCLDEADENVAQKHYKDSIGRGREALEKTVSGILSRISKKPSNKFSTDIGTLNGMDFINKESKRLIEATYSYLSEVGAHGRAGEVSQSDSYYALKEVYIRIDVLLNCLEHFNKRAKKTQT